MVYLVEQLGSPSGDELARAQTALLITVTSRVGSVPRQRHAGIT